MNVAALSLFPPQAMWIGAAHPFDLHEVYLDFRAPCVELPQAPSHAELLITGDSRYKLWVNGVFVSRGPARCYPWQQSVDALDLTPYLRAGANHLAVQVYQPGYSHFAYVHRGAAGLLASLVCDGQPILHTAPAWRVRRDPSFADLVPRVSIYGSGVEDRTLALSDDWTSPAYDYTSWDHPRIVAPLGGSPWSDLKLRATPLLREHALPLPRVETRRGAIPATPVDAHQTVRTGWRTATPSSSAGHAEGWFPIDLAAGEAAYWLFDLGRAQACQGWVEIEGASGQEQLLISYAEKLRDGELVLSDPQTYCRVRLTDRFRLRPGNQVAEPFALRGGRRLLFMLTGPSGPGCRARFHARTAEYPLEIARPLAIADAELAEIAALCERTFYACLQDGFVDCAWRESSQWLGDALPQALIMAALSDDVRPLRQVLVMAADGAYPDGVLPSVLPGEVHAYAIVDYNFMWIELLDLYQMLTFDDALVAELWPALVKLLDRFHQDLGDDGLIRSQPGRRLFLDWAPVSRQEPSAIYNLHYLLGLQTAIRMAEVTGKETDAKRWQQRALSLRLAVRRSFRRGRHWYDDPAHTTFSQLAAAFAVLTGAAYANERSVQLDQIVARSLDPDDAAHPGRMVLASPFMHHYLFEALRGQARTGDILAIIRLRWGRWARAGEPTTWENWNVDFPDGSQCHAFSAHPLYHLLSESRIQGIMR